MNSVDDERAEQIAEVLGMDLIEVRRNLGLWVPSENNQRASPRRPDPRVAEILRSEVFTDEEKAYLISLLPPRADPPAGQQQAG